MKRVIFIQSEFLEDVASIEAEHDVSPKALRKAILATLPATVEQTDLHIYVEDDDEENALEKLKDLPDGMRVHIHRQKGIDVVVRYAGKDVRRTFRPSATVARVKKWSAHELGIAPSDAAELMLQIAGTDTRPDADTHVGTLVKSPAKVLSFDLVPSPRVNG